MAKRRAPKDRRGQISADAIAAYRVGDCQALHRLLGLMPWEASPFHVDNRGDPSPWPEGSAGWISWPKAAALREQLEATLAHDMGGARG